MHDRHYYAVKAASGFYDNPKAGLPSGSGLMMIFDAKTGFPRAVLQDGGYLTDLRTGAAGALAVDLLAPLRKLNKVAIIGTGSQGRFQLRAISQVRKWDKVMCYDQDSASAFKYAREMMKEFGRSVDVETNAERCVTDADLIVTVTPSYKPIIKGEWISKGATVICVGSDRPDKRETEGLFEMAETIVCDSYS